MEEIDLNDVTYSILYVHQTSGDLVKRSAKAGMGSLEGLKQQPPPDGFQPSHLFVNTDCVEFFFNPAHLSSSPGRWVSINGAWMPQKEAAQAEILLGEAVEQTEVEA